MADTYYIVGTTPESNSKIYDLVDILFVGQRMSMREQLVEPVVYADEAPIGEDVRR